MKPWDDILAAVDEFDAALPDELMGGDDDLTMDLSSLEDIEPGEGMEELDTEFEPIAAEDEPDLEVEAEAQTEETEETEEAGDIGGVAAVEPEAEETEVPAAEADEEDAEVPVAQEPEEDEGGEEVTTGDATRGEAATEPAVGGPPPWFKGTEDDWQTILEEGQAALEDDDE